MLGLSARYFVFCLPFLLSLLHAICSLPLISNSTSSVRHLCSPKESSALLHFKNSFSIERNLCAHCDLGYRKTESWKQDSDCCTWEGVSCDELTGHITGLDLSCAGLSGSLHDNSSLFLLRHLQRLNLACGDFGYSKISSNFGGFSELTHLDLSASSIIDPFPSEISHLSKLISLDLSSNHFTLNQHTFDKLLKNLTQLRNLILDQADLSLVVPESLTNVSTSLRSLSLRNTGLQGKFPVELFHLPFIQLLLLSGNGGLTGELPKSNWSCPLEVLELSYSGFSGILQYSIGNLRYLDVLDLSNSHFSGQVPASLSNLEQLTRLDLSENNFTGQFPDVFSNLSRIISIVLTSNNFCGQLLSSVFNITQLHDLDFSRNQFSGHLPNHGSDLPYLTKLNIDSNFLNGRLPSWLFALPSLESLDLSDNNLTGFIESEQFQQPSGSLTYVNLRNNQLHGQIPNLIFEPVNLHQIDFSYNELSGVIKPDMFAKLKNLFHVDLSHNNLLSLTNAEHVNFTLPKLTDFILSSCNLTEFPFFLRAAENLERLDVSNNSMSGRIRLHETNAWQNLVFIDLSQNFLRSFEMNFSSTRFQYLNLHSNMLQGSIINPSPFLSYLSLSQNNLTGEIPYHFAIQALLNSLICLIIP